VAEARSKAEQVANEPTAAAVADDKFTQLIETLQAGDIASKMTGSIEQSSQNLRTVSGASVLTRLMNNQQQLDQRQVQLLQQLRDVQRRLVTVTEKGLVAWEV
jgi:ATP-dependent Lon protease